MFKMIYDKVATSRFLGLIIIFSNWLSIIEISYLQYLYYVQSTTTDLQRQRRGKKKKRNIRKWPQMDPTFEKLRLYYEHKHACG